MADAFRELDQDRQQEKRKHSQEKISDVNDETNLAEINTSMEHCGDSEGNAGIQSHPTPKSRNQRRKQNASALGKALMCFLQEVADYGRRSVDSPIAERGGEFRRTRSNHARPVLMREQMKLTELISEVTRLDDEAFVSTKLAQYPTQDELDQELRNEIEMARQKKIADEIARGKLQPYPLEDGYVESEQMKIWQSRLAEIFEFFVNPMAPQFISSEGLDDKSFLLGRCFRTLDCDQDGIISRADAQTALIRSGSTPEEAKYLTDVLMWTVPVRADDDGITWEEFSQIPPPYANGEEAESVGACWRLLLDDCKTPSQKVERAVQIQQRDIGRIWIEPNGAMRDPDEMIDWNDSSDRGFGAIFTFDEDGRITVYHVARPGPADGKLWVGDIIVAINGESVERKGPGQVISRMIAAGADDAEVELKLQRDGNVEQEVVSARPPALPPRIPVIVKGKALLEMTGAEIGFSSLLKFLRMSAVLPKILQESELSLICQEVKLAHVPTSDGEMFFSFDEFKAVLIAVMGKDKFFSAAKEALTSQVGRRCFGRLHAREQRLGSLYIVMQLPRRMVPGGLGWIKIRYYRHVAIEMIHQQENFGHSSSFSDMHSNMEVRIMSQFQVRLACSHVAATLDQDPRP